MIIGRHQRGAAFPGNLAGDRLAIAGVAVVGDDLAAQAPRVVDFRARCVGRHHDRGVDSEQPAGHRHALGVVAGRERDDASRCLVGRQLAHQVVRAAYLERTDRLQILGLDQHRAARDAIELVVAEERGANRDAVESCGRRLDGADFDHSASAARRSILAAQMKSLSESPSIACVV